MAYIDLTFNTTSLSNNTSLDIGDTIYYTNPTTSNGTTISSSNILIGDIESITNTSTTTTIKVNCELDLVPPTASSFIFFSKDNVVNLSSIKGYYNSVQFTNDSTTKAELFATSFAVSESSK